MKSKIYVKEYADRLIKKVQSNLAINEERKERAIAYYDSIASLCTWDDISTTKAIRLLTEYCIY